LNDADGIDPSLFFDDDGRAWYVGTRPSREPAWDGQTYVWMSDGSARSWPVEPSGVL